MTVFYKNEILIDKLIYLAYEIKLDVIFAIKQFSKYKTNFKKVIGKL